MFHSTTTNPGRRCSTIERVFLLLLHLILLIFIYIQVERFIEKQENFIGFYRKSSNQSKHFRSKDRSDCSCSSWTHPKRNRSTHCLQIHVGKNEILNQIFCPNSSSSNSWFLIQNRRTNEISFNRTWNDYRRGFGHVKNNRDFWIGNENLHWLTSRYSCRLKIELTDWFNETRTAIYETFQVASQNDDYRLIIDGYHGNIDTQKKIDSFSRWHYNTPFSTYDHYATDHLNCPELHGGAGWWYHFGSDCAHVQLNGEIATHRDGLVALNRGILWIGWKSDRHYSFQHVNMAIQRKFQRPLPSDSM